ncbi:MAG: sodium:solute symporter family protein [Planctomycetota bacterium]|nr:sodium:solute symporter family protein [Planctomycetota bacterium]
MSFTIILCYLALLLFLGIFAGRLLKKSSGDFFLASRGIGPFMLLMSVFGTTMTAFALIGSTGKTFEFGIGVYGLMASWSGIIHAAIFFLLGAKVWALGKKHGYVTQLSYFRDRYQSDGLVLLLFPLVVCFVILYLLIGVIGAGRFIAGVTPETFRESAAVTTVPLAAAPADLKIPEDWKDRVSIKNGELSVSGSLHPKRKGLFMNLSKAPEWKKAVNELMKKAPRGAVPKPAGMAIVCLVVLFYVFFGGMRATAWANTMQTLVFMVMGLIAFYVITDALGGPVAASEKLLANEAKNSVMAREGLIGTWQFLTYCFIPLSVGMFPHLFQHWLTAKKASNFKLTVVAHPICILITWVPCVLLGMWAFGILPDGTNPNAVLGMMVARYSGEVLAGLIGAGVLAAIMSSMDSQFLCLSSLFTNDIVSHHFGKDGLSDEKKILLGRGFVVAIVLVCYLIGLSNTQSVFDLGVWCFTGFAGLFPILFAALYWKRSNKQGAIAGVLTLAVLETAGYLLSLSVHEGEFLILGMMPVAFIVTITTAVMVIVTLMTPPPNDEIVEKFFPAKN